jgi:hypothetical protein
LKVLSTSNEEIAVALAVELKAINESEMRRADGTSNARRVEAFPLLVTVLSKHFPAPHGFSERQARTVPSILT